jgi:hypothetical protein
MEQQSPVEPIDLLAKYLKTKPSTVLITSYTLGLSYLEKQLLSTLKKKHDTKISIVTSAMALNESFDETVSLSGVGTEYYLFPINDFPYAFHPKIFLAVDEKDQVSVFASGANFTYSGMCLNLDAVESVSGNQISQMSKDNIVSFLDELQANVKNQEFQKTCNSIKAAIGRIAPHPSANDVLFIHNAQESIFNQIKGFMSQDVVNLRIVSPYFDKDMGALKRIVKDLGLSGCELFCNKDDMAVNLAALADTVKVFVPQADASSRFVHAKSYIFETTDSVYTCIGSANCTHAGLMSTSKTGNWEACILRRHAKTDHANGFWNSFSPVKISKSEYWQFVAPQKPVVASTKSLSFNALLTYNILKIVPLSGFPPAPFDAQLTFNLKNSDEETIYFRSETEEIRIEMEASLKERFGSDPVSVKFQIGELQGRAWLMQEHQLRKTSKIRSLEKAISQLQAGDPQGWDQALDIIHFIAENLSYVSASPSSTRASTAGKKDLSRKVPLIGAVVSIDDEILINGQSLMIGDFIEFGKSVASLIEKGLSQGFDFDDQDDDDDDFVGASSINGNANKSNGKNQPVFPAVPPPLKYHQIISQIPGLNEIFYSSVCQPFSQYLKNPDFAKDPQGMERFEAVLDSINFCLKFARFLRLELCRHDPTQEMSFFIKKYLTETSELLRWFWKTYPLIIEKHEFSQQFLHDAFLKTETLDEMSICLMEFWYTNQEDHFLKKEIFFVAFETFWSLYGIEHVKNSATGLLSGTERFNKERENLLFAKENCAEILSNIEQFNKLERSVGKILEDQIKYHYWLDASRYHEQALQHYEIRPSIPRTHMAEHQRRLEIASNLVKRCESEGPRILGADFCAKIYDYQKVAGISEIRNELVCTFCPGCNRQMEIQIYQTLKKFETCECPQCHKLFLPIDKPVRYSFADTKTDPEWKSENQGGTDEQRLPCTDTI